jgi:hypothetical protein
MKRFLLNLMLVLLAGHMAGQHLVVGNSDFIGHTAVPNHAFLLEGGPGELYWISGSYYESVAHPLLKEVYSDYECLYFIKYTADGEAVVANQIYGTSVATNAFSYGGALILVAGSFNDVDASGNVLPINQSERLEFIARYDAKGSLEKIISIWNTPALVYPYSSAAMDAGDGSIYIYGHNDTAPLEVNGYGPIGEKWPGEYFYVLKYNRDLEVQWAYTAGFEPEAQGFGYFTNLMVYPDDRGNMVVTGSYESGLSQLQFGTETLPSYADGLGLFAVRLNGEGDPEWVQGGTNKGYGYQTYIHDGFAMENGDLVFAGITGTGYFQLGDASFTFPGGTGFLNQFVYRMGPDGSVRWSRQFQNMAYPTEEEKKSAEDFVEYLPADAVIWNRRVLYLAGNFTNNALVVAGRELALRYTEGIYLASIDLRDGSERWGYALSASLPVEYPDHLLINGLDVDSYGNVAVMGTTGELQEFEGIGSVSLPGTSLIFHLGLGYEGNPLWYNNAHLQDAGTGLYGTDLEVLESGAVFSSMNMETTGSIVTEYDLVNADFPCTNWLLAFRSSMELSGTVMDATGKPVYPGMVRAIRSVLSGAFPAVDSVMLDEMGRYTLGALNPGRYTLQAIADPGIYVNPAPTYLGDRVRWSEAQFYDFGPEDKATFLNITIVESPVFGPQDGDGTMSGNVSYADEGEFKHTLGRPVKKASVILVPTSRKSTLQGSIVAYTKTDDLGNYSFQNVPDGNYLLVLDIAGLPMIQTYEVAIVGDQVYTGLDYVVGSEGIDIPGGVHVPATETGQARVFPNPGTGHICISLPGQEAIRVMVYGADGRLVRSLRYPSGEGIRILDISGEEPGPYLIRMEGSGTRATVKYLLR